MALPAGATALIIRPEWLIDGRGDEPLIGYEVVIDGGTIAAVRPVGDGTPARTVLPCSRCPAPRCCRAS